MSQKPKLELTWIGKENRPRLEPRILLEDPEKSYHSPHRVSPSDQFDNRLIFGDNLLALKALEQEFTGRIKCIYIDPPFNTGQAFEHYDDCLEHSLWLGLMIRRAEILRRLLREDGVFIAHLDQEEAHYFRVALDEVFGRTSFLGDIAYERSGVSGLGQGGSFVVNTHEHILCYAKNRDNFEAVDLTGSGILEPKDMKRYNRVLVNAGEREEVARFVAPSTGEPVVIYRHRSPTTKTISLRNFEARSEEILNSYRKYFDSVYRLTSIQKENEFQNRILSYCKDGMYSADYLVSRGRREGEQITSYYQDEQVLVWLRDTAAIRDGQIVRTGKLSDFWPHSDIPKANLANEGGVEFRRGKKPEALLERLLNMTTRRGDLVLDSFAGSGTTGAVAHKMGRRWIMVELGEHCHTHIIPRLARVIDGQDPGGITGAVDWKGGGGFRYYRLAPSLLTQDKWGNWVISQEYNAAMLAEALCKLEGFAYAPSDSVYWQQGHSTQRDFLYVTTASLSRDQLQQLSDEVGSERTLLVLCTAFRAKADAYPNLTVRKIPKQVLSQCEWGHDDYSLQVENLPKAPPKPGQQSLFEAEEAET